MSDGPKRTATEPTLVLDLERALSERARKAIEKAAESYPQIPVFDPDPEEAAELRRFRQEEPTLVPCPTCATCSGCGGSHMVTPERFAELKSTTKETA